MTDTWTDPRIPAAEVCVVRYVLDRWAQCQPEKTFAVFADGTSWSYRDTKARAEGTAAALAAIGVQQGEHVATWLPNGPHALQATLGINYLGAVSVPFNTAYRGRLLEHVVENSDAEVLITHASLALRLAEIDVAKLNRVIVIDGEVPAIPGVERLDEGGFETRNQAPPALSRPIRPWDTQSIVYTSGTTGPSKGVLSSYLHAYSNMGP